MTRKLIMMLGLLINMVTIEMLNAKEWDNQNSIEGGTHVLPNDTQVGKLKISEVEFTYGSFDYSYNDFDDTKGRIRFFANNLSQLLVQQWMVGDYFPYTYWESNYKQINDSIVEVNIDNWFWGDKYLLLAYNDELKMVSDTIYVNDYLNITDPAILEALGITGIGETYSEDEKFISLVNGRLCAAFPPEEIVSMTLFSPNGKVVKTNCDNSMDVTQLSKGLYILSINRKNNKVFKKKIIL